MALCLACASAGLESTEGAGSSSSLDDAMAAAGIGAVSSEEGAASEQATQPASLADEDPATDDDLVPMGETGEGEPGTAAPEDVPDIEVFRRCATPAGVSGAPTSVTEMVELLNALPRPTSVACFMESLQRPLSVYATRSPLSAQPAVGEEVPRVFFLNEDLVMSVVIGGPAGQTLEFGQRVAPTRSVRGELEFPLRGEVTEETVRDRIMLGGSSLCANCHRGEQLGQAPYFGGTVVSDVVFPADQYEVDLERLREMRDECEGSVDSRCQRLSALFDFGAVQQVPFR